MYDLSDLLGIITMTTMTKMKPGMEGKSQGFSGQGSPYSAVVNPACIAVIVVVIVIFVVIAIFVNKIIIVAVIINEGTIR